MKIGLVAHPYKEEYPAGLSRAIEALVKAIIEKDISNEYTIFTKGEVRKPAIKGDHWKIKALPSHFLWLDTGLSSSEKQDVYIYFTPFMPLFFKHGKAVVIVHDLSYKQIATSGFSRRFKRFFIGFIHNYSLLRANKVIAISSYTKTELMKYYNISSKKIVVIHNGFLPICETKELNDQKNFKKHFLFVGVIKERKNVLRLVQAYKIAHTICDKGSFPELIIVGKGSGFYYKKIENFIKESNLEKKIILKGYLSDIDLKELYKSSFAFLYPSLIEGFGLPILEAMNCGVPVLTSNKGAMKEIASNAAVLVDPESVKSIAQGIVQLYEDHQFRERLIGLGYERQRLFSWENAASQYHKVIKNLF